MIPKIFSIIFFAKRWFKIQFWLIFLRKRWFSKFFQSSFAQKMILHIFSIIFCPKDDSQNIFNHLHAWNSKIIFDHHFAIIWLSKFFWFLKWCNFDSINQFFQSNVWQTFDWPNVFNHMIDKYLIDQVFSIIRLANIWLLKQSGP